MYTREDVKIRRQTRHNGWQIFVLISGVDSGSADVQKHLDMGRKFLENRQFSDALTQFHEAVDLDPNNYQTYFKRALVFLALGKYNQALKDFDKVIELKPDFSSALLQRANLLMKQGQLDKAHIDFENVVCDAKQLMILIVPNFTQFHKYCLISISSWERSRIMLKQLTVTKMWTRLGN